MLRFRLLVGAWAPGAFIAALRASADHAWWAVALTLAGLAAVISVLLLLRVRSSTNDEPFKLERVTDESAQVPSYLLTFVFPFLFLDADNWRNVAAYVVFAGLIAILVLRTDLILVQPLLLAAGYHLYKIETSSGLTGILMSSTRPMVGQTIDAIHLAPRALKLTVVHS